VNRTAFPSTVRPKTIRPFSPANVADAGGAMTANVAPMNTDAASAERTRKDMCVLTVATMKVAAITLGKSPP
jgi:hypothetical protein